MSDAHAAEAAETATGKGAASEQGATSDVSGAAEKGAGGRERGEDGKFKAKDANGSAGNGEDWRAALRDDEPDVYEFARNLASPADAAREAFKMRKDLSTRIKLPGKDATPEEEAKFRKALGAGKSVEDYKFTTAEGVELTDTDKEIRSKVADALHAARAPVALAPKLQAIVEEAAAAAEAEQDRVALAGREASQAALKKEWGGDYEANVEHAKRAMQQFGDDDLRDFLNSTFKDGVKFGDHPALIRAFGRIGRGMGEHGFVTAAVGVGERETLQGELDRLYSEHFGKDSFKSPAVQRRMEEINKALFGSAPLGAGAGR
jgi:hypothetical protein